MERRLSLLALLLMALGGGYLAPRPNDEPQGESRSAARPPAAQERPASARRSSLDSPAPMASELLDEFLTIELPQAPRELSPGRSPGTPEPYPDDAGPAGPIHQPAGLDEGRPDAPRLPQIRELAADLKFGVEFLVATVPDPIDAHVGWQFDPVFDAIQRAFEEDGFVLDRYWFPWMEYAQHAEAVPHDRPWAEYAGSPGVALFRPLSPLARGADDAANLQAGGASTTDSETRLWIVFLVGETPTSGVHKPALAAAFEYISRWDATRAAEGNLEIGIAGTMYSGSSLSVRTTIQQWVATPAQSEPIEGAAGGGRADLGPRVRFWIVAGGAMDITNKPTLQFQAPIGAWSPSTAVTSEYHGAKVPSSALNDIVFEVLLKDVDSRQIAMLSEANTVYGEATASPADGLHRRGRSETEDGARGGADDKRLQRIMRLAYPMQIGQLRTAYEKRHAFSARVPPAFALRPRPRLEPSLLENPNSNDLPPVFSPHAPQSVERTISQTLAAIADHDIRYVLLVGTDEEDIIFLARLIRASGLDVQLITYSNDLLFLHPDYNRYLQGMLIVSSYPLFMANQKWTGWRDPRRVRPAEAARRQFSNAWAEAAYNAVLAQLARRQRTPWLPQDYAIPFLPDSQKPPIWLTVVGRGGLEPVRCFPEYCDTPAEPAQFPKLDEAGGYDYVLRRNHAGDAPSAAEPPLSGDDDFDVLHLQLQFGQYGLIAPVQCLFSWFCIANAWQFLGSRRRGKPAAKEENSPRPFSRWLATLDRLALFNSGDGGKACEARLYQLCFFLALLLMLSLLTLPALVLVSFPFTWSELHWRHVATLVSAALAWISLSCVLFSFPDPLNPDQQKSWGGCQPPIVLACALTAFGHLFVWWVKSLHDSADAGAAKGGLASLAAMLGVIAVSAPCTTIGVYTALRVSKTAASQPAKWITYISLAGLTLFGGWAATMAQFNVVGSAAPDVRRTVAIFATRAARLTGGVSPLVPAFLFTAAFWIICVGHLRRLRMRARYPMASPFPTQSDEPLLAGIGERIDDLRDTIVSPRCAWWGWPLYVALSALGILLIFGKPRTIMEESAFEWFAMLAIPLTFTAAVLMLIHALATWACLSRLLRRLARHPIVEACARLPEAFKQPVAAQLLASLPEVEEAGNQLENWPAVEAVINGGPGCLSQPLPGAAPNQLAAELFGKSLDQSREFVRQGIKHSDRLPEIDDKGAELWALADEESRQAVPLIQHTWRGSPLAADSHGKTAPASALKSSCAAAAEAFIAIQILNTIRCGLAHLRNFLRTALLIVLLFLAAMNSYPFQPRQLLLAFAWLVGLATMSTAVYLFVQINRDALISRLSDGVPGRVTWDWHFAVSLVLYALLPLLVLLSMQFPQLSDYLSSPINALLKVVK